MSEEANDDKLSELSTKLEEATARIAELSRENAKWRRLAQGKDVITQEEFDKAIERAEAAEKLAAAAEKAAKKAAADLEAAIKARDEIQNAYTSSLKEAALTDALTKAGITNPVHLKAAKALLGSAVEVAEENGQRVVKAGDKPLVDFVTEWAGGEEGKYFRANGADGGNASALPPGGGSLKRSKMTAAEKAEFISKHGQAEYLKLPKE